MKTINIGLLGCGTVGTGVARILIQNQEILRSRVGAALNLKRIADIDIDRDRGVLFEKDVLTTNADSVVTDPDIDIVIETIGGLGIAKSLILKAIANGKQVVTANKALLASEAPFRIAADKGVSLPLKPASPRHSSTGTAFFELPRTKGWSLPLRPASADACR